MDGVSQSGKRTVCHSEYISPNCTSASVTAKNFFLISNLNLPSFRLKPLPGVTIMTPAVQCKIRKLPSTPFAKRRYFPSNGEERRTVTNRFTVNWRSHSERRGNFLGQHKALESRGLKHGSLP